MNHYQLFLSVWRKKKHKKLVFLRDHKDAVADAVLHSPSSYSIVFVIPVFVTGLLKNCISYNCTLPIGFPQPCYASPAFSSSQTHLSVLIDVAPGNQGKMHIEHRAQWQGGFKKECFIKKRREKRQSYCQEETYE